LSMMHMRGSGSTGKHTGAHWRRGVHSWARVLLVACVLFAFLPSGCECVRRRGALLDRDTSDTPQDSVQKSVDVGGIERTFRVHVPPSYAAGTAVPLVFVLHGGGGEGEGMERLTHMDEVADSGGFIAVYPYGIDRNWNDGRPEINPSVDDVGFFRLMLDRLESDYSIDTRKVYSTGISNGGFMSYRLAFDLDGRIAAIAPVGAPMSEQQFARPPPSSPVSVLLIHGVDDPLCPWSGGDLGFSRTGRGMDRGRCVSVADTIGYWVSADGCGAQPVKTDLPDADPGDGTRVREELYGGGRSGTDVELLAVEGGGHTWPGGLQYLSERIIGRTNRDIDASSVIWEFFKSHSLD